MKENDSFGQMQYDEKAFRIAYLIAGFLKDTLSEEEHIELDDWVTQNMENQKLFEELTDPNNLNKLAEWKNKLPIKEAFQRTKSKIKIEKNKKGKLLSMLPYAAAIVVLGVVGFLVYYQKMINVKINSVNISVGAISPGSRKAILTLSNGKTIMLDSAEKGNIASDGNATINKDGGVLEYQTDNRATGDQKTAYNEIKIPRGGEFRIILPDGTKVWLNSASSFRYPTVFVDQTRNVELSGEAYFEVAKDASKPFIVKTGYADVTVLGTHFNVNAYTEDGVARITLLEGSVKVNQSDILRPGQEATVNKSGLVTKQNADTEMSVAWKDGLFIFRGATIYEVMKQVS